MALASGCVLAGACGRIAFEERGDATTDPPCPTCNAGLVAYWPFDETTGLVARDVIGGHDATLRDGTVSWVAGLRGGAARLDHAFGQVDWDFAAAVPNAFTVAMWFAPGPDNAGFDRYFSQYYYTTNTDHGALLMDNSNGNGVRCIPHTNVKWTVVEIADAFPTTGWRHVACSYDGTTLRAYANATVGDTQPLTGTFTTTEPLQVGIGASVLPDATTYQNPFDGTLDDVRIFNRALTDAEMTALATR